MTVLACGSLLLLLAVLVAASAVDAAALVAPLDGVVRLAGQLLAGAVAFAAVFLMLVKLNVFRSLYWRKFGSVKCPVPETDQSADVIVIGAGVVGSALAHTLGETLGKRVLLVERDLSEPNRIVGELMQPGGVQTLSRLGLLDCVEGIDAPKTSGYVVFNGTEQVLLDYEEIHHWDSKLQACEPELRKAQGTAFHHGRFVQRLRKAAMAAKGVTTVEATVQQLLEQDNSAGGKSVVGVRYKKDGEEHEAYAPLVVACDGVNSKFRRQVVEGKPKAESSFVGLVLDHCELPQPDRGHVILVDPSPILAYPISSTETRILVDIPHPLPSASNGDLERYMRDFVCPQLPEKMRPSLLSALETKQLRSMPCSRLHPEFRQQPGLLLLGDAFNMRHPLTGAGMTVGLSDVLTLRGIMSGIDDLQDQGLVQDRLQELYSQRTKYACTLNSLAQALYGVFSTHEPVMAHMREACFGYFKMGGMAVSGPISMLSCIRTSPFLLIVHFVAVALYSVVLKLLPIPWPSSIALFARIMVAATYLLVPLLWYEHLLPFVLNC